MNSVYVDTVGLPGSGSLNTCRTCFISAFSLFTRRFSYWISLQACLVGNVFTFSRASCSCCERSLIFRSSCGFFFSVLLLAYRAFEPGGRSLPCSGLAFGPFLAFFARGAVVLTWSAASSS
ncbi:hypothetical protein BDV18DRAFT_133544 [Aspergillus unguis]